MSPLGGSRRILGSPRPTNITAPTISGTARERETLTATSVGTWRDFPTSFSYQWRRGSNNISGATNSTYTLVAADVGNSISVAVTATNASGPSAARISNATANVTWGTPINTSAPTISGTAVELNTLTANRGSWTSSPTSYAYQWQRLSGSTWTNISGATGTTYSIRAIAVGQRIRVRVIATNPTGSTTAFSAQTAVTLQAATGGSVSTTGNFRVHTFNSSGTFTLNRNLSLQYVVVAGGGGGGRADGNCCQGGGGGGAGGYRSNVPGQLSGENTNAQSSYSRGAGNMAITVGGGGARASSGANAASSGGGSGFAVSGRTSSGGGRGGNKNGFSAASGGSGGGAAASQNRGTGASGASGQGRNGGNTSPQIGAAGGGGGSRLAGGNGFTLSGDRDPGRRGGAGGAGTSSNITGSAIVRAGGGGGWGRGGRGAGGAGGGGTGALDGGVNAANGSANTGGGGGGGGNVNATAGNGGSGQVIIRYAIS